MYNFKYKNLMKDLFIGALAVAVGVYVEKKYKVCDKIAEQVKNFTGKDSTYEVPQNPELVIDTKDTTPIECAKKVYDVILSHI